MDFERIAREVASGLLDPLLERRDYGGNQLDKGLARECSGGPGCDCDHCVAATTWKRRSRDGRI